MPATITTTAAFRRLAKYRHITSRCCCVRSPAAAVSGCRTAASELKAIGFWFDTILPDDASDNLSDYAKSVKEIEELTGYTFFPDVDAGVKNSYTLSEWGL